MSRLIAEWRDRKGREDSQLHDQLKAGVLGGRVEIFTDSRMLDFQGSPVHNAWDHLAPLIVLMTAALVILLAAGVAIGIVAMTACVLAHLFGNKYYVGWRLKQRAVRYMLESTHHWQQVWHMGGIALVLSKSNEPPCLAPKGDWRKFTRRNLGEGEAPAEPMANAPVPVSGPQPGPVMAEPAAAEPSATEPPVPEVEE
jgi:hypothetical protein